MPELKRNFMQGRMNKDLDERLIPDGEYRDALNIEVSTAEESSVGTARNIPGNQLLGSSRFLDRYWKATSGLEGDLGYSFLETLNSSDLSSSAITVGAITDPATDKIYSFLANTLEPYYIPAGMGSTFTPTQHTKTTQAATSSSFTVTLNNVTDLVVGMVLTGTNVVFGTIINSINNTTNTVTLNKLNTLANSLSLVFQKAALVGCNTDSIFETRSAQYQATAQSDRLNVVFNDVYAVHRVPQSVIKVWQAGDSSTGGVFLNTSGPEKQDKTTISLFESINDGAVVSTQVAGSAAGQMNFANGIYEGADVEIYVDGVNILTEQVINPVTGKPIGKVKVSSIQRTKTSTFVGFNQSQFARIHVTLNKAIPGNIVTQANIEGGLYFKFSNERLLNFSSGVQYDYTETNSAGTTLISNHPTPIDAKITSIDVVEGVLYFTDGKTEPKRIDIEKGIKGSNFKQEALVSAMLFETTQMSYLNPISFRFGASPSNPLFNNGLGRNRSKIKNYELEDITVIRRHPLNPPTVDMLRTKRVGLSHGIGLKASAGINFETALNTSIVFTVTKNKARTLNIPSFFTETVDDQNPLKNHSWRVGDILVLSSIFNYSESGSGSEVNQQTPSNSGDKQCLIEITEITSTGTFSQPGTSDNLLDYHATNGVVVKNTYGDAEHGLYDFGSVDAGLSTPTYTKYDDILTITAKITSKNICLSRENSSSEEIEFWEASLQSSTVNADLFKSKFPRYAIRYKYDDNQLSAISPFTEPCFLPKDNYSWTPEEGENAAMENDIKKIVLRDFVTPSTPVDVKQIDVLVKFDGENSIYKLDTIKKGSREWNDDNGKFAQTVLGPTSIDPDSYTSSRDLSNRYENGSFGNTRGVYSISSEKLGAVIPSNQILRPFDAVPVKAKAQCISANRLIYGNYTLDYDLVTSENKEVIPRFFYSWKDPKSLFYNSFRETTVSNVDNHRKYGTPEPSIKSNRNYTLGVSFLDRFGRQSPVIVGPESSYFSTPNSAYTSSRLKAHMELEGGVPHWATHYRFYIKETSNEYYNLSLYRAYPAEGDGSDEENRTTSYWLAFHSADRNKIQEDSVIRLKCRGGGGAAARFGDTTYKVQAISNEAPKDEELASAIPAEARLGKFYVKVKSDQNLIFGLKGGATGTGGELSDYHSPAIFETDPDPDIGLNVFFEIPRTYPIKLNKKTIEEVINFGDFVSCFRTGYDSAGNNSSAPTFRAVDSLGTTHTLANLDAGGTVHDGTFDKPNELFHLFDNKMRTVREDLTTKILHVRGSDINDGIQNIQLNAVRNFGLPLLVDPNDPGRAYLSSTTDGINPDLVSDNANATGAYSGNYNEAAEYKQVGSITNFGSLHVFRNDGTKSSFTINNFNDDVPGIDNSIGMGYAPSPNTTMFDNDQTYLATNTVQLNSLAFTSEQTLPFHNCWHFGNGVESDRIRGAFNAPKLDNGVKASSTADTYGQKHYKHGLIFSGLYNAKTDINNLNQFIKAEGITKDLNPEYGSIQKLFTRNTNVLAFCENKVLKILSNKDALFNADGNTNVTSIKAVLGSAVPFSGDHGISRNPESFAENEFRCYFTDRDRGVVCRLSMDGITPISQIGMSDYFADQLKSAVACVGAFNDKKGEYDLTIHNNLGVDDVDSDSTVDVTKRVQTISFNEKKNSWVSFKSYVLEHGLSLNNEYYTIQKGKVYLHSDDAVDGRNNFYGTQYFSSVTPVFNDAPGSVKSFQTINYEGTQAQVIANSRTATTAGSTTTTTLNITSSVVGLTVGQVVTSNDFTHTNQEHPKAERPTIKAISDNGQVLTLSSAVTIAADKTVVFSDAEYYNDDAYTGWFVESIVTDQQEGKVLEFKEKEGKWFNNISGVATTFSNIVGGGGGTGNIDSQEFSVQGIGHLDSISGAGDSGLFYSSTVTATMINSCSVANTVSGNVETEIPHGTNFGTYSSFDAASGKQEVTICPATGYSFVDPDSIGTGTIGTLVASAAVVDSVTLNASLTQANNIANTFTTTVTQATTVGGCIKVTINWHNGYTPNANTTLSVALAADTSSTALPMFQYLVNTDIDLVWEEGGSSEWTLSQPLALDTNFTVGSLATDAAGSNVLFANLLETSGNDSSCFLSGNYDSTSNSYSFCVEYVASEGTSFPQVIGSGLEQNAAKNVLETFIFPELFGFGNTTPFASTLSDGFWQSGPSNTAVFGGAEYNNMFNVWWEFTEYDGNGLAKKLKATYTIDFDAVPTGVNNIPYSSAAYAYGCSVPSLDPSFSSASDPMLLWKPKQDINGGDEPVIPDDIPGGLPIDPIEEPIVIIKNSITVVHQNAGDTNSAGVNTPVAANFFTAQGDNLNQATATVSVDSLQDFTFVEANITQVDGNAHNTPSDGVATYTDGSGGDTLTAKIHTITCQDAVVNGVTVVKISFTFESFIVLEPVNLSIIIKGNATSLVGAELAHSFKYSTHSIAEESSGVQNIFGNGSSGVLQDSAAPDGNYNISVDDTQIVNNLLIEAGAIVLGTSVNNTERTIATITYETKADHRFISLFPDNNGNALFLHLAGAVYDGGTDLEKIAAWLYAHYQSIIHISSSTSNEAGYTFDFAVTSSGSGSGLQEKIVITVKYTGAGGVEFGDAALFRKVKLAAAQQDNSHFL